MTVPGVTGVCVIIGGSSSWLGSVTLPTRWLFDCWRVLTFIGNNKSVRFPLYQKTGVVIQVKGLDMTCFAILHSDRLNDWIFSSIYEAHWWTNSADQWEIDDCYCVFLSDWNVKSLYFLVLDVNPGFNFGVLCVLSSEVHWQPSNQYQITNLSSRRHCSVTSADNIIR